MHGKESETEDEPEKPSRIDLRDGQTEEEWAMGKAILWAAKMSGMDIGSSGDEALEDLPSHA